MCPQIYSRYPPVTHPQTCSLRVFISGFKPSKLDKIHIQGDYSINRDLISQWQVTCLSSDEALHCRQQKTQHNHLSQEQEGFSKEGHGGLLHRDQPVDKMKQVQTIVESGNSRICEKIRLVLISPGPDNPLI